MKHAETSDVILTSSSSRFSEVQELAADVSHSCTKPTKSIGPAKENRTNQKGAMLLDHHVRSG